MKRALIVYGSVSGATADIAQTLEHELLRAGCQVETRQITDAIKDISSYDTVFVGGPMRFGGFYKPVKQFIRQNERELSRTKVYYFLTLLYVIQVEGEELPPVSVYYDPSFKMGTLAKENLTVFDKTHTAKSYLELLLNTSSVVTPQGIGLFNGRLDLSKLDLFSRLFMKIVTALTIKERVGDYINRSAAIEWLQLLTDDIGSN